MKKSCRDQLLQEQLEMRGREFAAKLQKVEEEVFDKEQEDRMKREEER